ncbi:probable terpene synthase 2 [Cicer arietinum]|uniref:(E)-beta-ocimene synthase n=1 Tax=Cicer arietinum TaxID=3827 RepID=A0A1S2Z8D5_CICAR|nr:probable terpene synthase 2 [Cicer arietinum]
MPAVANFDPNSKLDLPRNVADYPPNVWGDFFLQYASESMELDQSNAAEIDSLKNEVRNMLATNNEKPFDKVKFIDSICRLGVGYHFEHEIDQVLQLIHKTYVVNGEIILDDNLHSLAVLFRVLRQRGLYVSPDVFKKFKDDQGIFSKTLIADVEGMLSLYEASHMMIHGEEILEEALAFTSTHLKSISTQLSHFLATQVKHSLTQSLRKNLPRLEARRYISVYEQDASHNVILLRLAKLDFNMLQSLHQKEFGNICKWSKELGITKKLPYARDRIVECCFWSMSVYFEPQYSQARKMMSKVIAHLSFIDDTYDSYGTVDELELFTKAVERWDISCLDDLPNYMKLLYKSLLNVYEEIKEETIKEGREYTLSYFVKDFKTIVQAYMTEARWLDKNHVPTIEEYMPISKITSGYPVLSTTSFVGMGSIATEDIFNWVTNMPKIVNGAALVCRLNDEIVSNEFEQQRGHVSSFLECYMIQYDTNREAAIQECEKGIDNAWKDINEDYLRQTKVPLPLLTSVINLARFIEVYYKDKDHYTHSEGLMKTHIKALIVDPVPV